MAFSPLVKKKTQSIGIGFTTILYTGIIVIELLDNVYDSDIFIFDNSGSIGSRRLILHFGGALSNFDRLCANGTSYIFAGQRISSNKNAIAHIFEVS